MRSSINSPMAPTYEQSTPLVPWRLAVDLNGESHILPPWAGPTGNIPANEFDAKAVESIYGWFCRLSEPEYQYMDGWYGPFKTKEEARECIRNTFEVDADSGLPLDNNA